MIQRQVTVTSLHLNFYHRGTSYTRTCMLVGTNRRSWPRSEYMVGCSTNSLDLTRYWIEILYFSVLGPAIRRVDNFIQWINLYPSDKFGQRANFIYWMEIYPLDKVIHSSYNGAQYYIVLYCIVLYCIVLYCIVLYCIVLYCTVSRVDTSSLLYLTFGLMSC